MKDILKYVGVHPKSPLERAKGKAYIELGNVGRNPHKLRDYWYHYEALARELPRTGVQPETLAAHHARPRRGILMDSLENAVAITAASEGTRVGVAAQRL